MRDFITLTKPRITFMVVLTALFGYYLAAPEVDVALLVNLLAGTALSCAGAGVLNMAMEKRADGAMTRTRHRPIPAGRVEVGTAVSYGGILATAGVALLAVKVNALTAALSAATIVLYVLVYTPLKSRTSLCTVVGAIPGALPPVMGWAAARGTVDAGGWALFGVLFFWQLPHFLAIAWIHREDYARGGFPMLPVSDRGGDATARQIVAYAAALVPATLVAGAFAAAGPGYLWSAVGLGALFLGCTVFFAVERSDRAARWVFLASVLYLPAVLGLMVLDR